MKKVILPALLSWIVLLACSEDQAKRQTKLVFVEGGDFILGEHQFVISKRGDTVFGLSTSPYRKVKLDDFYISSTEITVREFREFCKQTNRKMPDPPSTTAYGDTTGYKWVADNPMLATWDEANAYAKWAGGRLPTEAEWEYAAKGGKNSKGYTYSGSNTPSEVGWVSENADSTFHAVGLLKPNELGLFDMTGNITEWVSDWYNPEKDHLSRTINPAGPAAGKDSMKIAKGVSWYYDSEDMHGNPLKFGIHMPEVRYQSPMDTRNDGFGFRIAKDK